MLLERSPRSFTPTASGFQVARTPRGDSDNAISNWLTLHNVHMVAKSPCHAAEGLGSYAASTNCSDDC